MELTIQESPLDLKATKVLIKGMLFRWAEKAPFVPSGQSILGAVEVNEDETQIKCHECGKWRAQLSAQHLSCHNLPGREYRNRHGLCFASPLAAPALRRVRSEHARKRLAEPGALKTSIERMHKVRSTAQAGLVRARSHHPIRRWTDECANLRMKCRAQVQMQLLALARELGHTPTTKEMNAAGIYTETIRYAFGMTPNEALRAIGLRPNRGGHQRIASTIELAILRLRAGGASFREIADKLAIDRGTAAKYAKPPSNSSIE